MPISASPTANRLLSKVKLATGFELQLRNSANDLIVASHRSPQSQLCLQWRPDGEALSFLARRNQSSPVLSLHVWLLNHPGGRFSPMMHLSDEMLQNLIRHKATREEAAPLAP